MINKCYDCGAKFENYKTEYVYKSVLGKKYEYIHYVCPECGSSHWWEVEEEEEDGEF